MRRELLLLIILLILCLGCTKNEETDLDPLPERKTTISDIERLIDDMTLEEKIGQLLMVGIEGKELDEDTKEFLKQLKVGGVILFKRNIESIDQAKRLTKELEELKTGPSRINMFIGTDQEGGRVNRLPAESGYFPSARNMANSSNPDTVKDFAKQMAVALREIGINMNFAPILDINSNPENPVIGDRSFGDNPEIVRTMGMAFIQGTLDEGIIPVVKHFPGHGDTAVDSHTDLPVIRHSVDRLRQFELVPFQEAISREVPAVMTAHILLPQLDEHLPATLSSTIVNGLLREELQFDGVVVSDDLDMGAITRLYSPEQASVKALKAGVDILLICHNKENMLKAFNALIDAVNNGGITMEEVDKALMRVLNLKKQFGLIERGKHKKLNELRE